MQIKEISSAAEIADVTEIFAENYGNFDAINYAELIENALENGYKLAAIFSAEKKCVAAIGTRISQKIRHGKILEIEDFLISNQLAKESEKAAEVLIHWAQELAKKSECDEISVNIKTKNTAIQKIFSQKKFVLDDFLFRGFA